MLCWVRAEKPKEDAHMFGRLLVATIAGVVAWKYRDSLTEYMKGNTDLSGKRLMGYSRQRKRGQRHC
jgi:hypothetical protein